MTLEYVRVSGHFLHRHPALWLAHNPFASEGRAWRYVAITERVCT